MRTYVLIFSVVLLGGCQSKLLDRALGAEDNNVHKAELVTVSCCRNEAGGVMTYPAFLPASHVALCEEVRHTVGGQINGDTYIAMGVDCGHNHHTIGDEYYPIVGY